MRSPISPRGSLLGAARPRVEVRPALVEYSLGPEAVELAARAGLPLEPWQRDGLELMLSVRPDGRWACFEYVEVCARQNGKSALFMARALAGLFLLGERLVMWSAHEYKTAMESFLQVKTLIEALGDPVLGKTGKPDPALLQIGRTSRVKINSTNGEEAFVRLELDRGRWLPRARLKFVARSKGSGRGFTADAHLIDEAFAYTDSQRSALAPTLLAVPNAQVCYASSPPLDSESGEVLFALRERAQRGSDEFGYRDWGLAGSLDDLMRMDARSRTELLDDRSRWAATNPAAGRGRVTEESIARLRRAMSDEGFGREVLGMWPLPPTEGGRVIRAKAWDALVDEASSIVSQPVFAVDANPEQTHYALAAAGRNADGRTHLELVPWRRGMAAGEPWPRGSDWVVARCVELDAEHEPGGFLVDPGGPAGHLVKDLSAAGLVVHEVTGRAWAQACAALHEDVHADEPALAHLGDPVLGEAVAAGRKRDVGDGAWAWGRKNSEVNIAPLCAVTLARHGVALYVSDLVDNVW